MKIWVDADACPVVVKEMLYRAAMKRKIETNFVANQPLRTPRSPFLKTLRVGAGFDVADNYIVEQVEPGDLVITADIPLAADVIAKGGHALNPRGTMYTKDNIGQRLSMRNFLEDVRSSGIQTGGPPPIGNADKQAFGNALDRFLTQALM
ncbi:MAG TPA: YaiI/YqxD family protein [Gammaproteobacteria bacterium]|nr:YaiI/YqxD family protein [Gammaproteobacteria bacterium]